MQKLEFWVLLNQHHKNLDIWKVFTNTNNFSKFLYNIKSALFPIWTLKKTICQIVSEKDKTPSESPCVTGNVKGVLMVNISRNQQDEYFQWLLGSHITSPPIIYLRFNGVLIHICKLWHTAVFWCQNARYEVIVTSHACQHYC